METKITTAHIMVTSLCDRDCKYCCNKQYDLDSIPTITDAELREMKDIFLTGGEPFVYSNPNEIARYLKEKYRNVEKVIVYSNAYEFAHYIIAFGGLNYIDGVTLSIKSYLDVAAMRDFILSHKPTSKLRFNRLYVFPGFEDIECPPWFDKMQREWQEVFVPATNCIFRRL